MVEVASPPAKAVMIYDGDCNFCSLWIHRWQQTTGNDLDYLPFQDPSVAARFPEVPRGQFEAAVQLVETDGRVYGGAEAVFRALAHKPRRGRLLHSYQRSPAFPMRGGCSIGMNTRWASPTPPSGAIGWWPGIAGCSRS